METENGSALTVTFYISKNSFVNQCYEEKQYLASNNVIFLFFSLLRFESSQYTLKQKKNPAGFNACDVEFSCCLYRWTI